MTRPVVVRPLLTTEMARRNIGGSSVTLADGVLTFVPDLPYARRRRTPSAPVTGEGAVTNLVIASYKVGDQSFLGRRFGRLLFCAADGSVVFHGQDYETPKIDAAWPPAVWAPLEAAGIPVVREEYGRLNDVTAAHPGAATPAASFFVGRYGAVVTVAVLFVLLIGGFVAYTLVVGP